MMLAEYAIATGDDSVLPGLRRIALKAAQGQSIVGSRGDRSAGPDGRLVGSGMMNSPQAVLTIDLTNQREARALQPLIERTEELFKNFGNATEEGEPRHLG
jgi:hypothetical protein